MKKLIVFLALVLAVSTFGQKSSAAIKLGFYNPQATDGGFIIGYQGARYVDNFLDIGWSIDWFNKNYVDKQLAEEFEEFDLNGELNELRAKTNIHDIPIMFNMTAYFDINRRAAAYANIGVGAEVLLVFYRNYQNPDEDKIKGAFDFSWRLSGGVVYTMGRRSELLAEIGYHSSEPSWNYTVEGNDGRKRTFERSYDMSGIMLRAGVKFYY